MVKTLSTSLKGVKVVDFSWAAVGPTVMKYLSDYGATVIKVESTTAVEVVRTDPPFKDGIPGVNRSGWFTEYNSSKLGMTLNLNHPRAIEVAKKLVAWADIVASSFTLGTMERRGLGYEDLTRIKPDIIVFTTTNMGRTGPRAKQVGYGTHLAGHTGFDYLVGWADRDAIDAYGAPTDYVATPFAAAAVLAALDYRRRTDKGQLIDLSQFEASVYLLAPIMLDYTVNKRIWGRRGNRSSRSVPHGAYQCQGDDRWCAITIYSDEEWESFCRVIGNPAWTKDPKFATHLSRMKNATELDQLVEKWTMEYSAEQVMTMLQEAEVPAGVVENSADMHKDAQLKHRHHFWELKHPEIGKVAHRSLGFKLSRTPEELRVAPCLGEHNYYICTELLGISEMEFINLLSEGVLE